MARCGYILETKLNQLLKNIGIDSNDETLIKGVSDKINDIKADWIFVAIKGFNVDGNTFVNQALDLKAFVVSEVRRSNTILVTDAKDALCNLLHAYSGYLCQKMFMIGVTGTNGKTTTASLIKDMFNYFDIDNCAILTHSIIIKNEIIKTNNTTPDPKILTDMLQKCIDEDVKVMIMELSSESMYYQRLTNFVFDIIICTNITSDHLNTHKTFDNYLKCKYDILKLIKKRGVYILNNDDKNIDDMINQLDNYKILYGTNYCDFNISNIKEAIDYTSFDLNEYQIKNKLLSKFNAYNLSACIAVGFYCDFNYNQVIDWANKCYLENGRLQVVKSHPYVIVDYAHTIKAFEEVLDYFNRIKSGKIISVFGCGGDRDQSKRAIIGKIVSEKSDLCIITNDNPRSENQDKIIADIIDGCTNNYIVVKERKKAIEFAIKNAGFNDIILVLGKGIEEYQLINGEKIYHNDIEVIKNFGG